MHIPLLCDAMHNADKFLEKDAAIFGWNGVQPEWRDVDFETLTERLDGARGDEELRHFLQCLAAIGFAGVPGTPIYKFFDSGGCIRPTVVPGKGSVDCGY